MILLCVTPPFFCPINRGVCNYPRVLPLADVFLVPKDVVGGCGCVDFTKWVMFYVGNWCLEVVDWWCCVVWLWPIELVFIGEGVVFSVLA